MGHYNGIRWIRVWDDRACDEDLRAQFAEKNIEISL
jgi:hypothetical protein